MTRTPKSDTWVWVVIQDPGKNEQFLGQHDEESNISFIPAFYQKEDAQQCLIHMATRRGTRYEIQGIFLDELTKEAALNNFQVFLLDADGQVLEKISASSPLNHR